MDYMVYCTVCFDINHIIHDKGLPEKGEKRKREAKVCSTEIPISQNHGDDQCPHIEGQTHPAGSDLHPHGWPFAGHGVVVCVRANKNNQQSDVQTFPCNRVEQLIILLAVLSTIL